MKRAGGKDNAPAKKRPYVQCHLVGPQQECARLMAGLTRQFGPAAIGEFGHSFPAPRHGPDWVSVHLRVTPAARPRRRLRPRIPRRGRGDVPAQMIPVKAQLGPAGKTG